MSICTSTLFNGEVTETEIDHWLQQFEASEQVFIQKLLSHFTYYDTISVRRAVSSLHNKVLIQSGFPVEKIWFIPVGYVTKSGSVIAYFYRSVNGLAEGKFISSNDILRIIDKREVCLVFIDDYIGTGHQARQVWDYVLKPHTQLFSNSKFYYCTLAGTKEGIKHIAKNTGFEVITDKRIGKNELPFSKNSKIFTTQEERNKAEEIVRKYGEILYPGNPLGYKNSQALIGFFYSTPNNTLPIFWSINEKWHPLLTRNESYRDPKNLIGNISGLNNYTVTSHSQKVLNEISKLEEYDASPEFITKSTSEFQKLPNILSLIQPMKQLGFSEETFGKIIALIGTLKRNIHEKEPVKTSLLLVSQTCNLDSIGTFYIKTSGLDVSNINYIKTLAGMVYSYNNAIAINSCGEVLGILSLYSQQSTNAFLPDNYSRIVHATRQTNGLAIVSNGDDRVSILYAGERILLYRGASWSLSKSDLTPVANEISASCSLDRTRLYKIFEIVCEMSYHGKGALITIGDEENVKKYCEEPASEFAKNINLDIQNISTDAAIGIIEQDGATIIDSKGILKQAMTFLRPPSNAPGKVELNKGSKHSTAVKISAITKALVIAVSVDGRISFYIDGNLVMKMMG